MIEQQGRVVSTGRRMASVQLGGRQGCSACDAGKGCGAGLFGRLLRKRPVVIELENGVAAGCGQAVMVGIPESVFLRLVTRLYLAPLLAALTGAVLGHFLAVHWSLGAVGDDLLTLAGALVAAAAAIYAVRRTGREFPAAAMVHLLRTLEPETIDETRNPENKTEV